MTSKERTRLFDKYREWPRHYYHIVFETLESGQLFYSDRNFADGMNSVAVGQSKYGIRIFFFVWMINHAHFIVFCTGNQCVDLFFFLKNRINAELAAGCFPQLPDGYAMKLVPIEDERQLADAFIYCARNPYKARRDMTPSGYPWGTGWMLFSEIDRYLEKTSLSELSGEMQRKLLKTRIKLPQEYVFNGKLGIILPESYVEIGKVESILKTSWNYCSKFTRDMDAYVRISQEIGDEVVILDNELDLIIYEYLKSNHNVTKVRDICNDDRCRLAIVLKKKYRIDDKRICRKLGLQINVLAKLFE